MSSDQPSMTPPNASPNRRSLAVFALLCVAAIAGVIAYALYSRDPTMPRHTSATPAVPEGGHQLAEICRQPHLLFRNTAPGPSYGRLVAVPLDAADGSRYVTPLLCDRVHGIGKSGICLQASRGAITTYQCVSFDINFQVLNTFKLAGIPSRTRVSRDGRMAGVTVFVTGDSYGAAGFSTRATIFDLGSANVVGDLEQFSVQKNGQPFKAADFNFWGITFAKDSDRFYATLATGGKIFLVEGLVSLRAMVVLNEGVECPSLSPNGTRLVFKSRTTAMGGRLIWRLHVIDLNTQAEIVVNELRSVDDQSEWLDDEQVLYTLPRGVDGDGSADVWVARADGAGTPQVFVHDATSPCVVRP
jgi:hypothetical protein